MEKSKHHEIKLEDLQSWLWEEEATFASSTRERKRLTCSMNGNLKVYVGGKVVYTGTQPFGAMEAYNAITEKYKDSREPFTF